jgi:serine/threonine protein phosphatase PrpC
VSPVICPICREPAPAVTDRFCEVCGARLRGPSSDVADRVEVDLTDLAGISDRGHVHLRNEDAMALGRRPEDGSATTLAAVVCDGVSTVRRPELASRTAATVALDALLAAAPDTTGMVAAVAAAADAVSRLAPGVPDAPSCTLVAALVDTATGTFTIGWVGDSRAYWLADNGDARLLTADHSWAAEMVGAGILDPGTAMRDPRAHAITRWLGGDSTPQPGVACLSPTAPGVLLLCTDGLWNYEPEASDLAALALPVATKEGPRAAATALTAHALDAGGRDNITVVCVPINSSGGSAP